MTTSQLMTHATMCVAYLRAALAVRNSSRLARKHARESIMVLRMLRKSHITV